MDGTQDIDKLVDEIDNALASLQRKSAKKTVSQVHSFIHSLHCTVFSLYPSNAHLTPPPGYSVLVRVVVFLVHLKTQLKSRLRPLRCPRQFWPQSLVQFLAL